MPQKQELRSGVTLYETSDQVPNYVSTHALRNLRSYMSRVKNGNWVEYRTPFAGKIPTAQVLAEWSPQLDKIRNEWPGMYQFEMDLASKVGPMSYMAPLHDRLPDIDHYYADILLPSEAISDAAVDAVLEDMQQSFGLRIRNQVHTLEKMKLSTNSGLPYFTKRRTVVGDTVPCYVTLPGEYKVVQTLKNTDWYASAVLGWRGQEGGPLPENVKQRVVWMFPFAVNINELQVYQPLIESAQRFNTVPAWVSMDAVDQEITQLFETKHSKDLIVCTDFEKFDQHFNADMQNCANKIIRNIFTSSAEMDQWLEEVYPAKYIIPLMISVRDIRLGPHGMGSGSGGTNGDETLTHKALQHEAAIARNQKLNPHSMCLGDDGILTFPGIQVDDVTESYSKHGQVMNKTKQSASTDECTYLRRYHHKNYRINNVCVGVYSTCRALGRLCEQERYYDPEKWSEKMVALRQLSIIENVKFHPLKEEFVKFCMKRDKYRLGIDIPGFLENIDKEAQAATDLMPDFLGYTKTQMAHSTSLSDWWVVRYLKSL